jgi:plastocyanin
MPRTPPTVVPAVPVAPGATGAAGAGAPAAAAAALTAALAAAFAAFAVLAAAAPLWAEELHGRLELLAKNGKSPARGSDRSQAIVYFEPAAAAAHAPKPPEAPFQLVTHNKEFSPHVLAVPVGSRVEFPNRDPILHNVFSVSPGNAFDLGIYRTGPPKEKRFDNAGLVRVYCNVHQSMVAYILVLDTSHYAMVAADGSFRLTGLPKGPGKLTVWHEQADPWSVELSLPLAEDAPPLAARLVVVRPKLPDHLNKTGEAYSRGDAYR